jgi:hypothetical protein
MNNYLGVSPCKKFEKYLIKMLLLSLVFMSVFQQGFWLRAGRDVKRFVCDPFLGTNQLLFQKVPGEKAVGTLTTYRMELCLHFAWSFSLMA